MNRTKRIRLLVSLVLTVAAVAFVVGNAQASRWSAPSASATSLVSSSVAKPAARPANGEPDGGQTVTAPSIVVTHAVSPLGGFSRGAMNGGLTYIDWSQWVWAALFTRSAR